MGVFATAGLLLGVTQTVPLEHSVTASVLLIPPAPSDAPPGFNPYLALGGLAAPAEVLASAMTDETSVQDVRQQGGTAEFTVTRDYATAAPIVVVTSEAVQQAEAVETLQILLRQIPSRFQQLQDAAKVPITSQISTSVVIRDLKGTTVRKPQIRALLATLVAGLGFTMLAAAGTDAIIIDRRRKRSDDQSVPLPDAGTPVPNPSAELDREMRSEGLAATASSTRAEG